MKLLLLTPLILLCGCSSTNVTKLIGALAKDPAIVSVKISSIYGTVNFTRIGGHTNTVTVTADGTISVGK